MRFQYDDGGRAVAGFKGKAGDCACRAVAIATGLPYKEVYDLLNTVCAEERPSKRKRGKSSSRTGVHTHTMRHFMEALGWKWVPTMGVGTGCQVHLRDGELPMGRIVVSLSRHFAAVVDGVLHDTYDCTRGGTRCVYGYWQQQR